MICNDLYINGYNHVSTCALGVSTCSLVYTTKFMLYILRKTYLGAPTSANTHFLHSQGGCRMDYPVIKV